MKPGPGRHVAAADSVEREQDAVEPPRGGRVDAVDDRDPGADRSRPPCPRLQRDRIRKQPQRRQNKQRDRQPSPYARSGAWHARDGYQREGDAGRSRLRAAGRRVVAQRAGQRDVVQQGSRNSASRALRRGQRREGEPPARSGSSRRPWYQQPLSRVIGRSDRHPWWVWRWPRRPHLAEPYLPPVRHPH